jgi:hypothetical protein
MKLGSALIVKNEEKRISVTLNSIKDFVSVLVILDTGSTDNTINIIKKFCEINKIELHLTEKTFNELYTNENNELIITPDENGIIPTYFHFSKARNHLLDFCENKADYFLLLDCNDELINKKELINFLKNENIKKEKEVYLITQKWWNGFSHDSYLNLRLIRGNCKWRYNSPIHEWLAPPQDSIYNEHNIRGTVPNNIYIYQDRTCDDDKSGKRFFKDEKVFESMYNSELAEFKKVSPRTLFYYAQTCSCINKNEKAYKLYIERSEREDGFNEERFHSYLRCGEICNKINSLWEERLLWYLKAYDYSAIQFKNPRVEPLLKIAEHHLFWLKEGLKNNNLIEVKRNWEMGIIYATRMCELDFPFDCTLFIDNRMYEFTRWKILAEFYCLKPNYYEKAVELFLVCLKSNLNENEETEILECLKKITNEKPEALKTKIKDSKNGLKVHLKIKKE